MSLRLLTSIDRIKGTDTHCPLCQQTFTRRGRTSEHIFPKWLQKHHDLRDKKLTIPNSLLKRYGTVQIPACALCNNRRFSQLEAKVRAALLSQNPFEASWQIDDVDLAAWLGKIMWLLAVKGATVEDYRTRQTSEPDTILPQEIFPGTHLLGAFVRTYALRKRMLSVFKLEPPIPSVYREPFSLYRFEIDAQGQPIEMFDFKDDFMVLGVAFRSGNVGFVCQFDLGLHRQWRHHHYADLFSRKLHPLQFSEVAGKMLFDQTVLTENARRHTYFWNRQQNAVIAMNHSTLFQNPYIQENYDRSVFLEYMSRHLGRSVEPPAGADPDTFITYLRNDKGEFWDCVNNRPFDAT